ncbi:MAG TPA: hypothetical protein VJB13_05235 [Candidatus Nanoarchaeia archaeon]|nr:hypothetical protein [Candidatus Nanoarchaeia archaeon]
MARILYGAPESEREGDNVLVTKLRNTRQKHQLQYLNDFLGFAWELSRCKDSKLLPQQYDLVMYDTNTYGENWLPELRAEFFKHTITPFLVRSVTPIIVLADKAIQEGIQAWVQDKKFHYVAQSYTVDEVVKKVGSLLPRQIRKKQQ